MSAAGSRQSRKSLKTRLTDFFDIEHPILSAPMALISGGRLSAAVTSAGGLGLIGGGYGDAIAIKGGEPRERNPRCVRPRWSVWVFVADDMSGLGSASVR